MQRSLHGAPPMPKKRKRGKPRQAIKTVSKHLRLEPAMIEALEEHARKNKFYANGTPNISKMIKTILKEVLF